MCMRKFALQLSRESVREPCFRDFSSGRRWREQRSNKRARVKSAACVDVVKICHTFHSYKNGLAAKMALYQCRLDVRSCCYLALVGLHCTSVYKLLNLRAAPDSLRAMVQTYQVQVSSSRAEHTTGQVAVAGISHSISARQSPFQDCTGPTRH